MSEPQLTRRQRIKNSLIGFQEAVTPCVTMSSFIAVTTTLGLTSLYFFIQYLKIERDSDNALNDFYLPIQNENNSCASLFSSSFYNAGVNLTFTVPHTTDCLKESNTSKIIYQIADTGHQTCLDLFKMMCRATQDQSDTIAGIILFTAFAATVFTCLYYDRNKGNIIPCHRTSGSTGDQSTMLSLSSTV